MRIHSGGRCERKLAKTARTIMAPRAKFFVVRGVLVDGFAHAAEAQPAEPHRGPPEDDLRGGARLQELEGMCAAGIFLNDSGVLHCCSFYGFGAVWPRACLFRWGRNDSTFGDDFGTVLAARFPFWRTILHGFSGELSPFGERVGRPEGRDGDGACLPRGANHTLV